MIKSFSEDWKYVKWPYVKEKKYNKIKIITNLNNKNVIIKWILKFKTMRKNKYLNKKMKINMILLY